MPPPRSTARLRIQPLGDTALLAELGTRLDTAINTRAIALAAALKKRRDVRQAIAGYASVTVHFDPDQATHDSLASAIKRLAAKRPPMLEPGRLHRIPVTYDGPDMQAASAQLALSAEKIVELHTQPIYRVFLVGFVPGWAYLGPLPEELVLPRRPVPRSQVPAGSVAIAGRQTGIYPFSTPGGWHLIGRTNVKLFLPDSDPPCLFRAGDRVKFFSTQT
jgi:inhibitor of KinA